MLHKRVRKVVSIMISVALLSGNCLLTQAEETQTNENAQNVVSWQLSEEESLARILTVVDGGEYQLSIAYRALPGRHINPEASLTLTGNGSTYEQNVVFSRRWCDVHADGRFQKDSNKNEVLPDSEEDYVWQKLTCGISSDTGSAAVLLEPGEYTLTITMLSEAVELGDISFVTPKEETYESYYSKYQNEINKAAEPIRIEAEVMNAKSDSSIIATYDKSSPSMSPSTHNAISLNTVGGSCWAKQGEWIEWKFEVQERGFYSIDVRYQQDGLRELGVGRKIYIDGEVPFDEFQNYVFNYGQSYQDLRLSDDDGKPYYVYLTKGEHALRMEVSETHLEQSIIDLKNYVRECNSMYRKIISITGASPDVYRDYYLDKELPELMPFLEDSLERLKNIAEAIEACSESGEGSETTVIHDMIRVYKRFIKKPYKIPSMLSEFQNCIDSMGDLITTLEKQSLYIDYINLTPVDKDLRDGDSNILASIWFRIKSFFSSFTTDYNVVSGDGKKVIKVWINMGDMLVSGSASGRDQMQIIKQLSDNTFTTESGVSVEFSLVSAGDTLSQAILAGKGPDVALFVPEQTVANLALRDALADMTKMKNYSKVEQEIYPSALVPYTFDGKVYGIAETQNFNVMFVRDDIFAELGLEAPKTWDEFYAVQQKLAEKKLEIGIPESQEIFEMMLLQKGGHIYNSELTASGLKTQESVEAFAQWTDLYVKYSLPLTFSFLNRFRTGEMPMGIMSYTMYNQLCVAAPEIKDSWSMYPIPGTVMEDGTINRSQSSNNTGCIVMSGSKELDAAYKFVEWWTDSETQTEFGRQVESVLGISARYNTANRVAFENLNWSNAELRVLKEARTDVTDIPQTMITYYVGRCISNAFRRVVYNYETPRDVIYRYSDDMDLEFARKLKVMEDR